MTMNIYGDDWKTVAPYFHTVHLRLSELYLCYQWFHIDVKLTLM